MSDHSPSGATEYETVGPGPARQGSRRGTVIAAVAVPVVAVLGGAAYVAYAFLNGGGPQPEDVLPASTVAVVSVDLDPSAGQKIAAITSIRKFPALKKSLGLHADDDLREFVFDQVVEGADCAGPDFDKDVKPWLGKRAAFAAVDLGQADPAPAIALQITDVAKAKAGFAAIVSCTHPEDFAYVVGDDYLIASDSPEHARDILDRGRSKPLAGEAAYRKWTGEAGDAGVVGFYVSSKAADYLSAFADGFGSGFEEGFSGQDPSGQDFAAGASTVTHGGPVEASRAADPFAGFKGLAGTVRFADGGMELSLAAGGLPHAGADATVGRRVGDLPADTAIALGLGVPDDFAAMLVDEADRILGMSDSVVGDAEDETGLDLPEDLQTLLGDSVTLSLGGDAPASVDELDGPDKLPVGLVIHGDPDKIKAVLTKIEDHLDMKLSEVPLNVEYAADKVVLSPSDYGGQLLRNGGLGDARGFRAAVPEADRANAVIYLDFDSPWRDTVTDVIAEDEGRDTAKEFDENTAPLRSLGFSSWVDGDVSHALLKVAVD